MRAIYFTLAILLASPLFGAEQEISTAALLKVFGHLPDVAVKDVPKMRNAARAVALARHVDDLGKRLCLSPRS